VNKRWRSRVYTHLANRNCSKYLLITKRQKQLQTDHMLATGAYTSKDTALTTVLQV